MVDVPDTLSPWIFQETATGLYRSGIAQITPEFTAAHTQPGWVLTVLALDAVVPDPRVHDVDPVTLAVTPKALPPAAAPGLDQYTKLAELQSNAALEITKGFHSSALGSPHFYPAQVTDQLNILHGTLISCCDGSGLWGRISHTEDQLITVRAALASRISSVGMKLDAARAEVKTATLQSQIDAVVLNMDGKQ